MLMGTHGYSGTQVLRYSRVLWALTQAHVRSAVSDGHERLSEEMHALTDATIAKYVQWCPLPPLPQVPAQMWPSPGADVS
jgi:hypothetical protein